MDIRAEVWSPLQNTAVWLGAWLHGLESTDNLVDALGSLGGHHTLVDGRPLVDLLRELRQVTAGAITASEEPVLRLVLSGPGEAPALRAGTDAARAASASGVGAIVIRDDDPLTSHILVPTVLGDGTEWEWFTETAPLPAPAWLSPGEADQLLTRATGEAARLVEASGYRTDALNSPRLTVGTLADFYDTPGLPSSVPARAAKLFARADRVAAIIETVTDRLADHRIDPQLLGLWRHIRAARMAGVAYAVREFGRI
ncbi:hypothetical protein [Corynebacterium halotolerans]|uniref:Uncharacterized protein n=1 Tax=Corynebacterium halotolerans YIM 70093 = DSM 44683 TaxID=1121362 RepID=M1P7A1_9CORY|nr:hypothetical protein [Corynebacterium halotolerans]AGF72501.1 hypothetical protein A605_07495 [Corynebacterium halotolerans YIM 70093 = DSM 44683]